METTQENLRRIVRESYRILLRAEADLALPRGLDVIADYYRRMAEACLEWVCAAEGEQILAAYRAIEDTAERARFPMARYRMACKCVWEQGAHAAWVGESVLHLPAKAPIRRKTAQVWNLDEQTVLPRGELLRLCKPSQKQSRPPFRADGVYPEGADLVFFRNATQRNEFLEFRIPYRA